MMNFSHVLANPTDTAPISARTHNRLVAHWRNGLAGRSTEFNENDSQSGEDKNGEVQFRFLGGASRS